MGLFLCSISGGIDTHTFESKQSTGIDENVLEIDGDSSSCGVWIDAEEAAKFFQYCREDTPPNIHTPDCVQNYWQDTQNSERHADIGDLGINQLLWGEPSEEELSIVILTISPALTIVICNTNQVRRGFLKMFLS
jgi:hypothetical protein